MFFSNIKRARLLLARQNQQANKDVIGREVFVGLDMSFLACLEFVKIAQYALIMSPFTPLPRFATAISLLTLAVSLYVSWRVNGVLLSTVRIVDLAEHGGVRFSDIRELKLWRFFTAQLVHVKWPHMLFNVACLYGIAALVERKLGGLRAFLIWAIAGGVATLISPIWIEPPYDVGTGASHAVLAFAGAALVMVGLSRPRPVGAIILLAICIIPAFALDFVFAGHPKIGHVVALALGAVFGAIFSIKD